MDELDERDSAALSALLSALANPDAILKVWRTKDLFQNIGEDGVRVSLGPSSSPKVAVVAERYERAVHRPFPALLRAFLSVHDGLNVATTSDGCITVVEDVELDVTNGFLPAALLESDETSDFELSGLRFAKAYHQSQLILVDEGERCGAVVFDDGDSPVVMASSLAELFRELAENGMSIEAVLSGKM
jgi:hypothetical protein